MTLDLDELTGGWECPAGELRARTVVGRDGEELLQLRVDLGVLQMLPEGRPDGQRCHGLASAREYLRHELTVAGHQPNVADWEELERELTQINYRRVAFSTLAEDAMQANEHARAVRFIQGALADIEACLADLELITAHTGDVAEHEALRPTLLFDRARLLTQMRIVQGNYEIAIEEAEAGAHTLRTLLDELGYDEETAEDDPGVAYLQELSQRLRREYGITQTLREQLEEALAAEDYERAAELRDELRRRSYSALGQGTNEMAGG